MELPPTSAEAEPSSPVIQRAFDWAISFDQQLVQARLDRLHEKHPRDDAEQLARRLISSFRRQGMSAGFLTGLPANPWLALPASAADVATMLHLEFRLAAHIALLYEPSFFSEEGAQYELLVPVFGSEVMRHILLQLFGGSETTPTRSMMKRIINKETLKTLRSLLLKHFAIRITRKALFAKMIPIVGGFIGGAVNYLEVRDVGQRIIDFFSHDNLDKIALKSQ